MVHARGIHLAAALAKALGLNRPITSIDVNIDLPGPIEITVKFRATPRDEAALIAMLGSQKEDTSSV